MCTVPKHERLQKALGYLHSLPPAYSSIEAYKNLEKAVNLVEDEFLGRESYQPPKTFLDGRRTERIYMTLLESLHPVPGYSGVHILINKKEITLISRFGAIEIQYKVDEDKFGFKTHFESRTDKVIFIKNDGYGHGVWHEKNK
jgi:hypothetical protein